MTIGEKIKYLRTRFGLTQAELASRCGIHPVSIRKYEINKMIPQQPQIDKICASLGVSSFALSGVSDSLKLQTEKDFVSVLLLLCKSNIISITGERAENGLLIADTVAFQINPVFNTFLLFSAGKETVNVNTIPISLKSQSILGDILNWEKILHLHSNLKHQFDENIDMHSDKEKEEIENDLEQFKQTIEKIELEIIISSSIPNSTC